MKVCLGYDDVDLVLVRVFVICSVGVGRFLWDVWEFVKKFMKKIWIFVEILKLILFFMSVVWVWGWGEGDEDFGNGGI